MGRGAIELHPHDLLISMLVYFVPVLFFMYMGMDVLIRNAKKVEHRILSLITLCYALMFLEEFIRFHLDMSYSPTLAALWLSNAGAMIPGLGFHFLVKFSRMDKRMPRYIYPYVFYLPSLVVVNNFLSSDKIISITQFKQAGIWKMPIFNQQYYLGMTTAIFISALYLIPLLFAKRHAHVPELKSIYNLMIYGVLIVIVWHIVFGYIQF